jgi:hypothetical protein
MAIEHPNPLGFCLIGFCSATFVSHAAFSSIAPMKPRSMAWRLVVGVLGAAALSGLMVLLIFPSGEWQESEAASQKLLAIRPVKGLHFPGATLNAPQLVGYGIGDWQQLLSSGNLDAMLKESNYRPGKLITPALKQVAALDLVQAGSYEARGFSFRVRNAPGGVEVIWLKTAPGGVDLIFTPQSQGFYESAGLKDGTLYRAPLTTRLELAKSNFM